MNEVISGWSSLIPRKLHQLTRTLWHIPDCHRDCRQKLSSQKGQRVYVREAFWTVVLEKILGSPLDFKEIKPVNPKGNQPWIFIARTDAKAPILGPPDAKSWLIWKDPDAGKDWGQEKGTTGWDGWMVSWTQWTWVWVDSGSLWWTGRPGMLQFMGL